MKLIFKALTIISLLGLSFFSLADNNDQTVPKDRSNEGLILTRLPDVGCNEAALKLSCLKVINRESFCKTQKCSN